MDIGYHLAALALVLSGPFTVIGPGALAPASPFVLERVEMTRLRHGYGLSGLGGPGVVKVAVDDCSALGKRGLIVSGGETWPAYVVDCCQEEHASLESLGIVADVNDASLAHKQAVLILWEE